VISKSVLRKIFTILGIGFVASGVFWFRMWDAHKSQSLWPPLVSILVGVIFCVIAANLEKSD